MNAENSRKAGLQTFGVKILNPPDHRSVATLKDKLGNVTKQRGFKVFRNFFNFITALIKKKFDRLHNRPHSPNIQQNSQIIVYVPIDAKFLGTITRNLSDFGKISAFHLQVGQKSSTTRKSVES